MLVDKTIDGYLEKVREFANKIKMREQLEKQLKYLGDIGVPDGRCMLYNDFAPYSFYFEVERLCKDGSYQRWFNGGLIFHGPHDNGGDGGAPTLSVCLNPTNGWSIHT